MVKIISFISFLFIFPLICKSQTDTTYFDDNDNATVYDYATCYRTYTFVSEGKYKVEEYNISDKIKMSGYYTAKVKGIRNGLFVFYEKGKKSREEIYEMGKRAGEWKRYYEESQTLWAITKYQNDSDYELTSYYPDGKTKRKEAYSHKQRTGKCFDEKGDTIAFTPFEIMPIPSFSMQQYLGQNLHYPDKARENNIEGRVVTKFAVTKTGDIEDIRIKVPIDDALDQEAIRVVSQMPKWIPGTEDGIPVKVSFNLPIVFKLQ